MRTRRNGVSGITEVQNSLTAESGPHSFFWEREQAVQEVGGSGVFVRKRGDDLDIRATWTVGFQHKVIRDHVLMYGVGILTV